MSKVLSHEARSKIAKRSKNRGATFERKVAKILTEMLKGTKYETIFHKTPASGGMRWTKERSDVIGDITCDRPDFLFTVECKKHESIDLEVLFYRRKANKSDDLISFYKQACGDAVRAEKEPILIVEKKRGKPYAIIPSRIFNKIMSVDTPEDSNIRATIKLEKEINKGWEKVVVLSFKEFLKYVLIDKLFTEGV